MAILLWIQKTLKESNALSASLFKGAKLWQVTFILWLNSAKVKKIGNVTVKNYLNESLLSLFCFIIYGQGSFKKGLMWTVRNLITWICFVTAIVFRLHARNWNKKRFLPLIANMLFVSINVSVEKICVKFPASVNLSCCVIFELNKFAYMCWNVIRGEFWWWRISHEIKQVFWKRAWVSTIGKKLWRW